MPLPMFAPPRQSSPLPEHPESPSPTESSRDAPPEGKRRRVGGRTATSSAGKWRPGGDPVEAAKIVGGFLVLGTGVVGAVAKWRGWLFRHPLPHEVDDIAQPVGRILVRHLPMDLLGPDLADIALTAAAAQHYALDGPLFVRRNPEAPAHGLEEYPA